MLKWILVAIALVLIGGCTLVVGGVAWFVSSAKAPPEFYEEVVPVRLTPEERTQEMEKMRALAFRIAPSLARQSMSEDSAETDSGPEADGGVATDTDPALVVNETTGESTLGDTSEPTSNSGDGNAKVVESRDGVEDDVQSVEMIDYPLDISEKELNVYIQTLLAEYGGQLSKVLSDPRIRLVAGKAKIGVKFTTPELSGVVGIEVEPRVETPKSMALVIHSIALGKIQIPVQQALVSAEIDPDELPKGIQILDGVSPPTILLSWDHLEDVSTEMDAATVSDGALKLKLSVPASDETAGEDTDSGEIESGPVEPDLSRTGNPRWNSKAATLLPRAGKLNRPELSTLV